MSEKRMVSRSWTSVLVAALAVAAVAVVANPRSGSAAGTSVAINDGNNTSELATVFNGRLLTTVCDEADLCAKVVRTGEFGQDGALLTRIADTVTANVANTVTVSDGAGSLTVDGAVRTANVTLAPYFTPSGGVSIGVGSSRLLATINSAAYSEVRVSALQASGPTNIVLIIDMVTSGAQTRLETKTLSPANPESTFNQTYDMPGTTMKITAYAPPSSAGGSDKLVLAVYGRA